VNVNQLMSSDPDDLETLAGMARLTAVPIRIQPVPGDGRLREEQTNQPSLNGGETELEASNRV